MTQGGADGRVPVGGNADPDAGPAYQDAAPGASAGDRLGQGGGKVRIVDRFRAVGAQIEHLLVALGQVPLQRLFQPETCVVGGNRAHIR